MTTHIGIIGSRTYPTKADVTAFVATLPIGTVVVSGGAQGPDTWAVETAKSLGLTTIIHWPDLPRYGSPAAFYHRNVKIVEDSTRIVAFAAKDPKTKTITAGTTMTLGIAERSGVPCDVIETPVSAKVCVLIDRVNRYIENAAKSISKGQFDQLQKRNVDHLLAELDGHCAALVKKMNDSEPWIEAEEDRTKRSDLEDRWLKCEAAYRVVMDFVAGARSSMTEMRGRFA